MTKLCRDLEINFARPVTQAGGETLRLYTRPSLPGQTHQHTGRQSQWYTPRMVPPPPPFLPLPPPPSPDTKDTGKAIPVYTRRLKDTTIHPLLDEGKALGTMGRVRGIDYSLILAGVWPHRWPIPWCTSVNNEYQHAAREAYKYELRPCQTTLTWTSDLRATSGFLAYFCAALRHCLLGANKYVICIHWFSFLFLRW